MSSALEKFPPLIRKKRVNPLRRRILVNYDLYLMMIPVLVFYFLFRYLPMYGVQIAFKDFRASAGIWDSPWVGFKHFDRFFTSYYFWRLLRNTLGLSLYNLLIGFPIPIFLALMINELQNVKAKKFVQNITYIPHFLSVVVVVGMLINFSNPSYGILNKIIMRLGGDPIGFMENPKWFKTLFVLSEVWQHSGWSAIIYIAALSGISPELFEAATVDGATRFQKMVRISLPCISTTIIILLILRIGQLFDVAFQKVLLMQNPLNLESSDVIRTYVYRIGLLEGNFSFSSAVGLFNSFLNLILIIFANQFSRKISSVSLW